MWGNRRFLSHLSAAPLRGAVLWRSREAGWECLGAVCPCGRNSERTCARWVGLCGGRKLPLALVINEGRQGTDPPQGVTAVFCEPEAEKNSVKRGIIPL